MPEIMHTETAPAAASGAVPTQISPQREFYIDRLRSGMTALVILHHTAITYGAAGGWFWSELKPSGSLSSTLLTLFCATNQAFFMGLFFLLAGYFTPGSLERKGYARFIADRLLRLGVPLLAFIVLLGPLTAAMAHWFDHRGEFWSVFPSLWNHRIIINGPLWFAEALLIYSLAYCAWRAVAGPPMGTMERVASPLPSHGKWFMSAIAVGAAALLIRQVVPVGKNVFGLQLGYFAGYTFLFAVGVAAWKREWLRGLKLAKVRPWLVTLAIAWPLLPVTIFLAKRLNGPGNSHFETGFSFPAALYAFWEPFVAWGLIAGCLLLFRSRFNSVSRFWDWLGRRAYAVYVIHPPVLVGTAILAHGWHGPALLKFAAVGSVGVVLCWALADPLVRVPGLRRIF